MSYIIMGNVNLTRPLDDFTNNGDNVLCPLYLIEDGDKVPPTDSQPKPEDPCGIVDCVDGGIPLCTAYDCDAIGNCPRVF